MLETSFPLLIAEIIALFGGLGAVGYMFINGEKFDGWTPLFILLVVAVWLCLLAHLIITTSEQPWWFRHADPDAPDLPEALATRIQRVRASRVDFDGRAWRTGPSLPDLAPDGDLPHALRWPVWLGNGHGLLVAIGLAGTFLGLTMGLSGSIPKIKDMAKAPAQVEAPAMTEAPAQVEAPVTKGAVAAAAADVSAAGTKANDDVIKALEPLLEGAMLAFSKSLTGILLATLWSLRLRQAENLRSKYLDELAEKLDSERPLLTPTHVQAKAAEQHLAALEALTSHAADQHAASLQRWSDLHEATLAQADAHHDEAKVIWSGLSDQLANGFEQNGSTFKAAIAEMVLQVRSALEKVPSGVTEDLGPKLDAIGRALAAIGSGGSDVFGKEFERGVGAEVTNLNVALQAVVRELQKLPPSLVEATTSMEAATSSLKRAHEDLRGGLGVIQETLPSVSDAARALQTAGTHTSEALQGAVEPIVAAANSMRGVADTIDRASAAVQIAGEGIELQNEAARELRGTLAAQSALGDEFIARLHDLNAETEELIQSVEKARGRMDSAGESSQGASQQAVIELKAAVATFSTSLTGIADVLRQGTTEGTQEAAKIAADASRKISETMLQLSQHATSLQAAMDDARKSGAALQGHAAALTENVKNVATPLQPLVQALQRVPTELNAATTALATERTAITGASGHAATTAHQLSQQVTDLRKVITEMGTINTQQTTSLQSYKQGIVDVNATVVQAWQQATKHAFEGNAVLNRQIEERAAAVEQRLQLPTKLTDLDAAISDLTDTLGQLNETLQVLRPDGENA